MTARKDWHLSVRGSEMCNKRKFRTELDAKIALVSSYYKSHILGNKNRNEIRYYWCNKCRAYHLTSKEDINGKTISK